MLVFYVNTVFMMFLLFVAVSGKLGVADIGRCFLHALLWPITVIEVVLDAID